MIESARFTNVLGNYIDFNDDHVPFNEFTTEVDVRFNEKNKSQEHGMYPGMTYLGKRLFHCSGDLLENSSAEYWDRRRQFIQAILPRPHLGYNYAGTLNIRFTGYNEDLTSDCTIDGWPEMPLAALSPSAGKFQVNFKAYDPRLYGSWQIVDLPFGLTENIGGRNYNKIYNKVYAAGSAGNDVIVSNTGDIETFPLITFYGPCSSPQMVLFRGDGKTMFLHLNGLSLLSPTDVAVVDVAKKTAILNNSGNVYNFAVGSDWWALEPGLENIVRYTADSGTIASHASVQWRNAYMI
jgi:Siphovirus-type tail component, C-terminal domain